MISKCCKAKMNVISGYEGTNSYQCSRCGEWCDGVSDCLHDEVFCPDTGESLCLKCGQKQAVEVKPMGVLYD